VAIISLVTFLLAFKIASAVVCSVIVSKDGLTTVITRAVAFTTPAGEFCPILVGRSLTNVFYWT
jgi:hypothetical protein